MFFSFARYKHESINLVAEHAPRVFNNLYWPFYRGRGKLRKMAPGDSTCVFFRTGFHLLSIAFQLA